MKKLVQFICYFLCYSFSEEILINSNLTGNQRDPNIAYNSLGDFVIVWKSELSFNGQSEIRLRSYNNNINPITEEIAVSQQNEINESPRVAMNEENNIIVVWASLENDFDIKGRLFFNSSTNSEEFFINSTIEHAQTNPDVAIWENGDFFVVWESWYQDGSDRGIYGRKFYANGLPATDEILINSNTVYSQAKPSISIMPNNSFVVTWESWGQDQNNSYGIYGQVFSSQIVPIGTEFQVNTYTENNQWFSDVVTTSDNGFIVVWCSWEQDGNDGGIYAQRFDNNGLKIASEVLINTTSSFYQWLPKISRLSNDGYAIVWSSWKQDGNREGVYIKFFDDDFNIVSFESKVNETTMGFQWEPSDPIPVDDGNVICIWSSSSMNDMGYNIFGKMIGPYSTQGVIRPNSYEHISGSSTTEIVVHVIDSLDLTGDNYELTFAVHSESVYANIMNVSDNTPMVTEFPINLGEGNFYLTPEFEGIAVQIIPEFGQDLNIEGSYFINQSGTNLDIELTYPSAGMTLVAPIDINLDWGNTSVDSLGNFLFPMDTAINSSGTPAIVTPFRSYNSLDSSSVVMLVIESVLQNGSWDVGEKIIFLTPPPYQQQSNNTHAELLTSFPDGNLIMPGENDSYHILTNRPLSSEDAYGFSTSPGLILATETTIVPPIDFILEDNYPNPFNGSTIIPYTMKIPSKVTLIITDIMGREVYSTIIEHNMRGKYKFYWEGINNQKNHVSSGLYFYSIINQTGIKTNKMILLK